MIDRCSYILSTQQLHSIPEFAALWCRVPVNKISDVLNEGYCASESAAGRQIISHPSYPCLGPRCQFIVNAISEERLLVCDESGTFRNDIAWSRRRIRNDKAIAWLEGSAVPLTELPEFLFQSASENIQNSVEGLKQAKDKIIELEDKLKNALIEIEKLKRNCQISENGKTTVNSKMWENSCTALARTFKSYIDGSVPYRLKNNVKKQDFLNYMKERVEGMTSTLTTVDEIAWKSFPDSLKQGVGRPKISPECLPF